MSALKRKPSKLLKPAPFLAEKWPTRKARA